MVRTAGKTTLVTHKLVVGDLSQVKRGRWAWLQGEEDREGGRRRGRRRKGRVEEGGVGEGGGKRGWRSMAYMCTC